MLDPKWLESARVTDDKGTRKVTDRQLAEYVAGRDADFKTKLQQARKKGLKVKSDDGEEMELETALLNYSAYGSTRGNGMASPTKTPELSDVLDDGGASSGFMAGVGEDLQQRGANFREGLDAYGEGKQSLPETTLQLLGQGAGFVGDLAGRGLKAAGDVASALTPDAIEKPIVEGVKGAGVAILESPVGQAGLQAIKGGTDMYNQWREANPRAARDLEAVVNIGSLLPIGKAGQVAKKGLMAGAEEVAEVAGKAGALAAKALPKEVMPKVRGALRKANARFSNVPDKVLERAYLNPDAMEKAIDAVATTPDRPFQFLAQETGGKLLAYEREAMEFFKQAKDNFKKANPGGVFDVSQRADQIASKLTEDFGIKVRPQIVGEKVTYALQQGKAKPFTGQEMKELTELVETMANAKSFGVDDLLQMNLRFDRAYDAVRLTEKKTAKPYHAAVMKLRDGYDTALEDILPGEMKEAYSRLASANKLLKNWGGKLLEGEGGARRVSQNAEGFIASLNNLNRGQRNDYIRDLENVLHIDLGKNSQLVHDAMLLAKIQAGTSGRPGDIVKSIILPMIGSALGTSVAGPVGSAAGMAGGALLHSTLSSPVKAAKRQIKAGRKALKRSLPI